jgi:uncharacterized phage-associated protein
VLVCETLLQLEKVRTVVCADEVLDATMTSGRHEPVIDGMYSSATPEKHSSIVKLSKTNPVRLFEWIEELVIGCG